MTDPLSFRTNFQLSETTYNFRREITPQNLKENAKILQIFRQHVIFKEMEERPTKKTSSELMQAKMDLVQIEKQFAQQLKSLDPNFSKHLRNVQSHSQKITNSNATEKARPSLSQRMNKSIRGNLSSVSLRLSKQASNVFKKETRQVSYKERKIEISDNQDLHQLCSEVASTFSNIINEQGEKYVREKINPILKQKIDDNKKKAKIDQLIAKEKIPMLAKEVKSLLDSDQMNMKLYFKLKDLIKEKKIDSFPVSVQEFMNKGKQKEDSKAYEAFDRLDGDSESIKNFIYNLQIESGELNMNEGVANLRTQTGKLAAAFQSKIMENSSTKDWNQFRNETLNSFFSTFESLGDLKLTQEIHASFRTTGDSVNKNLEDDLERIKKNKDAFQGISNNLFVSKNLFQKTKNIPEYLRQDKLALSTEQKTRCLELYNKLEAIALIDELEVQADSNYTFKRDGFTLGLDDFSSMSFENRILDACYAPTRSLDYDM